MCLILFSYKNHSKYKLILAANRDEFYARPTKPLSEWNDNIRIYAGKDLKSGGTWMGVTDTGRFAALTNYRTPAEMRENAPTRGLLVSNFLESNDSPLDYLIKTSIYASDYNGFNLLVGDKNDLYHYSNISKHFEKISPGIHGVSNHLLNTPWPKVEKGKTELEKIISSNDEIAIDKIFELLSDKTKPADNQLPDTGVGIELERMLSSIFIESETYGTRASSILLIDRDNKITFIEKSYIRNALGKFESSIQQIQIGT